MSIEDLAMKGNVNIHLFRVDSNAMLSLIYEKLVPVACTDQTRKFGSRWKLATALTKARVVRYDAGCLSRCPGQSSTPYLPMINMSSSDMT